ncbi:hypothetical protein HMPREF3224_02245, partial [Anaerococcus hydrogenalis]
QVTTAGVADSHDAQQGQTDAGNQKAKNRFRKIQTGILSQRGRENQVSRSEK